MPAVIPVACPAAAVRIGLHSAAVLLSLQPLAAYVAFPERVRAPGPLRQSPSWHSPQHGRGGRKKADRTRTTIFPFILLPAFPRPTLCQRQQALPNAAASIRDILNPFVFAVCRNNRQSTPQNRQAHMRSGRRGHLISLPPGGTSCRNTGDASRQADPLSAARFRAAAGSCSLWVVISGLPLSSPG